MGKEDGIIPSGRVRGIIDEISLRR